MFDERAVIFLKRWPPFIIGGRCRVAMLSAVIDRLYHNINKFYRLPLGNPRVSLLSLQYQNKRIITIKRNKIMEAKEKVLATMKEAGTPLNAGKIAELSGLDKKEVEKAMKQLKEEGAIVSPVRCKWAPAE